jgi:hypothetical protein
VRAAKSAELEVLACSLAEKIAELETACANLKRENESVTTGYRRNLEHLLKKLSGRRRSLCKLMLRSLLDFGEIWIWRPVAIPSTIRMFASGSVNFMKQRLHHLMRFTRGVCPSLARA